MPYFGFKHVCDLKPNRLSIGNHLETPLNTPSKNCQKNCQKNCRSVLIIEDNQSVRDALTTAIRAKGFEVKAARDGAEGLRLLATMPEPVLIFLDLMMPRLNGWEFVESLNKNKTHSLHQIVLISAVNPKARPDHRPLSSVAGWIQKPIALKSVYEYLNRACAPVAAQQTAGPQL